MFTFTSETSCIKEYVFIWTTEDFEKTGILEEFPTLGQVILSEWIVHDGSALYLL